MLESSTDATRLPLCLYGPHFDFDPIVGEQDRLSEGELPTDSYTMVNVRGAIRPFQDRDITVFAEAHNLTDEEAREHTSFLKDIAPLAGRNLRVGVTYAF